MMNYSSEGLGVMLPVSVDSTGRMLTRRKNCSGSDILPEERKYSETYVYELMQQLRDFYKTMKPFLMFTYINDDK